IKINPERIFSIQLLANCIKETIQRYAIILSLLNSISKISRGILEKESRILAQRLFMLHGINTLESFDKTVFSTLVNTLKEENYINREGDSIIIINIQLLYRIIGKLISPKVSLTIKNIKRINYE
ncbi:MAG: glycerol-3-phosphate 1-O-acyltransferase PlsB, partial [Arsenophonus sp. ET-DL12-MAG3]